MEELTFRNLELADLVSRTDNYTAGFCGFVLVKDMPVDDALPYGEMTENGTMILIDTIADAIPPEEFFPWNRDENQALLQQHIGQIMVSVIPGETNVTEAANRYLELVQKQLQRPESLGLYHNAAIVPKEVFLQNMAENKRLQNWVQVANLQEEQGVRLFTTGLEAFGKEELEWVLSKEDAENDSEDAKTFLYALAEDMILRGINYSAGDICRTKAGKGYRLRKIDSNFREGHGLLLEQQ